MPAVARETSRASYPSAESLTFFPAGLCLQKGKAESARKHKITSVTCAIVRAEIARREKKKRSDANVSTSNNFEWRRLCCVLQEVPFFFQKIKKIKKSALAKHSYCVSRLHDIVFISQTGRIKGTVFRLSQ